MEFIKFTGVPDKESSEVMFFPINKLPKKMGFDHKQIVKDALKLLRTS